MHCPRCGQPQVSETVKFCSRCGFLLELVTEILANGGVLPQLADLNKNEKWLTRKNGIKLAVLWTVVMWFVLVPLFGVLFDKSMPDIPGIPAILGFAGGVLIILISVFFLDNPPTVSSVSQVNFRSDNMPQNLNGNQTPNALPPQQSVPASSYIPPIGKRQTTNDLTAPPSVIEGTTKLLQKDE